MSYVPTFATRYLEDCSEQDVDPRSSLEAWIQHQSQSSVVKESHATHSIHDTPSTQQAPFLSPPPTSSDLLSPNPGPQALSAARFESFKDNVKLSSPKCLGPFITQTSAIFQEVIGGRATGEIEEEEEQGNRKVHGFVYTRQGKRKTVFYGALPTPNSTPTLSEPSTVPLPLIPPMTVRTSRVPRMRRRENTAGSAQEAPCRMCATYAQLRRSGVLRAVIPEIPLKCGPCSFKELRAQAGCSKPTQDTITAPTPTHTPKLQLFMKKRPLEAATGHDQMALQMVADVQRNPKRVRRVPARLMELQE